jgi:hypothetical protein
LTNLTGQQIKAQDHPIYSKYHKSEKLGITKYWDLHNNFLTSLDLKIDLKLFYDQMHTVKKYFKPWGNNRPELNHVRKGLPLVNLDGEYKTDVDLSIGPLDEHNKDHPDNCYLENDFTIPTDILNLSSFEPLNVIKPYMCRSSILYWEYPANFNPHWDVVLPTVNLRLWGTDNPDNICLRFKKNNEMIDCKNIEPGRLYLIETSTIHDATCIKNEVFQFFIALNIYSYDTIRKLISV